MTEFSRGIIESIKHVIGYSSITLAIIFFIGHMIIAMCVVSLITGASIWEAGAVAVVEPAINSVWFYILHSIYKSVTNKKTV
tara:strand:- start:378 stop:623 length:246 start_codon:yes stop_codon:yes gene_type:complete